MTDIVTRLNAALEGRYAIERELGAGGMATVYLAEDLKHRREVALKVLKPELSAVIGGERFVSEIRTTANLRHPHVLPLFDSGEEGGFLYYVMPFVEGESLRDRLDRERQLPIGEAVRIAKAVAAALEHAHRHGVIHRDIKPANILFQDGEPLVADFGIALAVGDAGGSRLTETGLSVGTPYYMSPEQATGDRAVDARSDVYSLGCILYEMLTGEPPHQGNTVQSILAKMLSETPVPVAQLRETVPANVDAAVRVSLARTPADRFQSAAAFADALSDHSFTLPDMLGDGARSMATPGGWRQATAALAGLSALLAATTVWAWFRPDPPAQVSRYSVWLPPTEAIDRTEVRPRIASSPDGSRFVYVSQGDEGVPRLWLRELDQLRATPMPGTEGGIAPFFSPDGSRVGYVGRNPRSVMIASPGGGPPVAIVDTLVGLDGASWGSEGFVYYDGITGGGTTGIMRVSESGGPTEQVTTVDTAGGETDHIWPHALPGEAGLLLTVLRTDDYDRSDVALADVATGMHLPLVRGVRAIYAASGHVLYVTADGTLMAVPFDLDRMEFSGEAKVIAEGLSVRLNASVDLAISDTGTLFYVSGAQVAEPDELVWVDREGRLEEADPSWVADFNELDLSPDGSRLVVGIRQGSSSLLQQLWVKQLAQGGVSRLTLEGNLNARVSWTPDGNSIVFVSDRGGSEILYTRRADGSVPAEPLLEADAPLDAAFLSADGEWLLYEEGGALYAQRTSGGDRLTLLEGGFAARTPRLSPDGRWLAYVSAESGQNEVYVRPFPDVLARRWQISADGGTHPIWASDGGELFYRTSQELVAVGVTSGDTFEPGTQTVLFARPEGVWWAGTRSYDVTPDGQRFLMVRGRGAAFDYEVIVVENLFEELEGGRGT